MKNRLTLTTSLALLVAAPAFAHDHGAKGMEKTHAIKMEQIDANNDGRVDFTEFSNHFETNHGWSAADSAVQFVRLAGDDGTLDEAALSMIDMDGTVDMDADMTTSETVTSMTEDGMTTTQTTTTTTVVDPGTTRVTVTASGTDMDAEMDMDTQEPMMGDMSTAYGLFTDYDGDGDGRVTFAEYSAHRAKSDISTTAAAQEFVRLSEGASDFDQTRFDTAMSTGVMMRPAYTMR